jgi:hypothetical protein
MTRGSLVSSMQPIIDCIGFDAAITLAAQLGGTRQKLAAEPSPRDPVVAAVGADLQKRLVAALGAGYLEIPKCMHWLIGRRNEEIVTRRLSGETHTELALRFGLTERSVRAILVAARNDVPPSQIALFLEHERVVP